MFGQWSFFLAAGLVPELQTEPIRIAFHLAAEFATAACLLASRIAPLRGKSWGRSVALFAAGMLAYTAVVSPGYCAQQGQAPLVGMFAVLLALDGVNATIERYTGNLQGSITGWKLTPKQAATVIPRTLPGLDTFWMVGHWVYPGGGVPAGVTTGREVIWRQCKKDKKTFVTLS